MRYLIDGYNLLFRIAKPGRALEKKREELIAELNQVIDDFKLKATVVFDGSHPGISHAMRHHFAALEIIYTYQNLSADEYIIEEVNSARRPEEIIVITSDRGLAQTCKNLGAKTQTIETFISSLKKKPARKKSGKGKLVRKLRLKIRMLRSIDCSRSLRKNSTKMSLRAVFLN